jgi:VIT1/CCC1 family predicted Fe2+/Mn2+ transporter
MTGGDGPTVDLSGRRRFGSGVRSFLGRHPVGCYLVVAFAIFWASWIPVLFFAALPRPFTAIGAILGLALPAFLITAATDGRTGVRDLLRRMLRWRVGVGWYLLAMLAIPVGAMILAPSSSGRRRSKDFCRTGPCCSPISFRSCCWH